MLKLLCLLLFHIPISFPVIDLLNELADEDEEEAMIQEEENFTWFMAQQAETAAPNQLDEEMWNAVDAYWNNLDIRQYLIPPPVSPPQTLPPWIPNFSLRSEEDLEDLPPTEPISEDSTDVSDLEDFQLDTDIDLD